MRIINRATSTEPLFLHAQGNAHFTRDWFLIVSDVIPKQKSKIIFPDANDITIVTFIHGHMPTSLDRQLKKGGVAFTDLAKHYAHNGDWMNTYKIKYLDKFLKEVATTYVLCLDAIDVLVCNDLSPLLERFSALNCDILYGASVNPHPSYLKTEESLTSRWKYMNCGTMLGKTEALKEFYAVLNSEAEKATQKVNNEQAVIRPVKEQFKNVKADTNCDIFQTIGGCRYSYSDETLIVGE
ncbi:MAG TPA: hypothetical protein PKC39_02235 [Ferruginibacter sp.]|nr:hypothetical protein [Ferruginibacter sp.]HMP19754.1 hypothetical protein [Ferruginibacter sp.]